MKLAIWGNVLAIVMALTGVATEAQSQSGDSAVSPGLMYRDIPLATGADGQTQSDVFPLSGRSSGRLFVQDRNVATARGPHDRVCVRGEGEAFPSVERLGLTVVGARPDARLSGVFWTGDGDSVNLECRLLPTASAYRVWLHTGDGSYVWPGWTRPGVFETFESMADQDDMAAWARNMTRLIDALQLDGVCTAVTLLRAPFSATEGTIGSPLWARSIASVASMVNASWWMRISRPEYQQQLNEIQNQQGWYRTRRISPGLSENVDAFVHPVQTAFLPGQSIEKILNDHMLDPQLGQFSQAEYAACHGSPILFNGIRTGELELYGYTHLVIVMPYWIEYSTSTDPMKNFWAEMINELMVHEMIHVYEFFDGLNQTVFQTKDTLAYTTPPRGTGNTPGGIFSRLEQSLVDLSILSVNSFHYALYDQGAADGQAITRNTDLRPAGPAYIGDPAVLRRAQEEFELWLRGQ